MIGFDLYLTPPKKILSKKKRSPPKKKIPSKTKMSGACRKIPPGKKYK